MGKFSCITCISFIKRYNIFLLKEAEERVPVEVKKDWVHMDTVEYDKLEWMKDLPQPTADSAKVNIVFLLFFFWFGLKSVKIILFSFSCSL